MQFCGVSTQDIPAVENCVKLGVITLVIQMNAEQMEQLTTNYKTSECFILYWIEQPVHG